MSNVLTLAPGHGSWTEEEMYKMVTYIQYIKNKDNQNDLYKIDESEFSDDFKNFINKVEEAGAINRTINVFSSAMEPKPTWIIHPNKSFAVWNNNGIK